MSQVLSGLEALDTWPAPALYFPVAVRAAVAPSQPWTAPTGDHVGGAFNPLELDRERARYLAAKRAVLLPGDRGPFRCTHAETAPAIERAEIYLRERMAQLAHVKFAPARLSLLALDALMLELQEDLAIMLLPAGYAPERARAVYLHVCFPAGWDPAQMAGKSFPALHARVPREPGFEKADQPSHAASLFTAPSVRFVWSVTPDAQLDRHPQTPRAEAWHTTSQVFLRVERQLSVPLGELGSTKTLVSLFFIRTYIYPLSRLDAAQRAVLRSAVATMSEPMRRYKGMFGHEARILALLSAADA